ncbi:(2Fe-2S)-binding protein [Variovorax paradoxus]|uniref:Hydrogen cyanide synthase subunit HcnA n=1 Tax=Variovorax paradoxus TaxID=34073 RepID=A0A0H2LTF6_VARPD|nr:(2Fe-2S)-binding protein [Variovorax paradoxus]KLN53533.1 hydrogen cyanide synthase subunit HcnA [Variovorax paradoxus]
MFKPIDLPAAEQRKSIVIHVEGREIQVREGQTLATALLGAGVVPFRKTSVSGAPRAPLCLMGVCFDCLVEVDGSQNLQSCLVEVKNGMRVRLPTGARRIKNEETA